MSTESVHKRVAVFAGNSGRRRKVITSSITLDEMCFPCRRLCSALARGELLRNSIAVIMSTAVGVRNIYYIMHESKGGGVVMRVVSV